ncbi:hypothetical protein [Mycolicibacterium pulveris]|uniref:hypothetical protein n=1 Tax=Mycolicibacterium pulveris TaxID=36813 RepID=UPI003CF38C47
MTSDAPVLRDDKAPPPFSKIRFAPVRVDFSQAEAREHRRAGWSAEVHYLDFDAAAEVRDQLAPLAVQVRKLLASPPVFKEPRAGEVQGVVTIAPGFEVLRVAAAVHRLRLELAKVLASTGPGPVVRERLAAVVRDRAHERRPQIDDESLRSGAWADVLVAHVEPLSADLAAVVAGGKPGRVSALDGGISDAFLSDVTQIGFDQAVQELERRIVFLRGEKAKWHRNQREAVKAAEARERQRGAEALRKLGLS